MLCPKCGAENTDQAKFCTACGAMMETAAAPISEEAFANETVAAEPVAEAAPKKDLFAPLKPLLEKVRPLTEKVQPLMEKYKLFVVGGLGILACVVCIAILCAIFGGGNGYDAYKHEIDYKIKDGQVFIIYDAKKAKATGLEAESIDESQTSIDGKILVLLTDNGDLAFVKGTKLTKVATEVEGFMISADGTGIVYLVDDGDDETLYLYNTVNKKAKKITSDFAEDSIAIAPNGDSVCYYEQKEGDDEPTLMLFKGSKSKKVTSNETYVVGMSNNGKYIYAIAEDDEGESFLYRYNANGNKDKIGPCNAPLFYFNEDHTQVIYYNGEGGNYKSYLSINGKEGKKMSSSIARPLLPESTQEFQNGYSITVPAKDLYNKVYVCQNDNNSSVWYIRKNPDKSVKLVGNASSVTLSEDGKRVFFMSDEELKVLVVKKGDRAADKAVVLAEDVEDYVVTSNGKKLYYLSDKAVYCVNAKNGKGKKTVASDEVSSSLYINGKDVVYFIKDGDAYATKNGGKAKKVVSDATRLAYTANGIVYVHTEDDIFATAGAKKPTKVFSKD